MRTTSGPVLVVEDHEDTRHMVQTALELSGFETIGAADGLRGLTALQHHRPCVILLDLSMPIMDGWRFRDEQQRLPDTDLVKVPVIVLSALSDCEKHARDLGAMAVVPKPVDVDRLIRLVQEYCSESSTPLVDAEGPHK